MDKRFKKIINSDKKRRDRALRKNNPEEYEDKKREEEYLKSSLKRLKEYDINRKRDKSDPLWEYSSESDI